PHSGESMLSNPRALVFGIVSAIMLATPADAQQVDSYGTATDKLIASATRDSFLYNRLAIFVDKFGNRLSGSENLERGIDWIVEQMKADGLENVHTEPVMVPHWVRGREYAQLTSPRVANLPMLGLGASVATP